MDIRLHARKRRMPLWPSMAWRMSPSAVAFCPVGTGLAVPLLAPHVTTLHRPHTRVQCPTWPTRSSGLTITVSATHREACKNVMPRGIKLDLFKPVEHIFSVSDDDTAFLCRQRHAHFYMSDRHGPALGHPRGFRKGYDHVRATSGLPMSSCAQTACQGDAQPGRGTHLMISTYPSTRDCMSS